MIADEAQARDWVSALAGADAAVLARLEHLISLLALENQAQNLVSAGSLAEVWRRHIADSAQLIDHVPRGTRSWLDLGSGAGFPGLVIAALRPASEVVLVESRKRRVAWLESARAELQLDNVQVIGSRVEDLPGRAFDTIIARAFAPLDRLLALSARFSTSDTVWLLPKGRSAPHELDMLRGWNHSFHVEQSLTDPDSGIIVGQLLGQKGKLS